MSCGLIRNMAGMLSACEELAMIVESINGMKMENFGKVRRKEMVEGGRIVFRLSLPPVPSFLERAKDEPRLFLEDVYSAISSEEMHNLHPRISKKLKIGFVGYFGPGDLCTTEEGSASFDRTFMSLKGSMQYLFSSLLAFIEKDFLVT